MADNVRRMGLHLQQDNMVGSLGNGLSDMHPSAAEQEVDGPGAAWNPVVNVDNQLPQTAGTLSQTNEAVENNSQGAVEQTSNLGTSNGAAVDVNNLLANPAHNTVQLGGTDDPNNGQLGFFGSNSDLLNPLAGVPHTAQAGGAGDDDGNEEFNVPLEEEAEESEDLDQDDYAKFMP